MKVGIFSIIETDQVYGCILKLKIALDELNVEYVVLDNLKGKKIFSQNTASFSSFEDLKSQIDLLITVGGDGTILKTVDYIRDSGIPIVGINMGRLGFLASIKQEEISHRIRQIIKGDYNVLDRILLSTSFDKSHRCANVALNEVYIYGENNTSIINTVVSVNDIYLNSYWSDGLIVATPTGSTGYSLSCGGAIIMPDTNNFIITPVAPHNLNLRPIIVSGDDVIKVNVVRSTSKCYMSLDSRIKVDIDKEEIIIKKSDFSVKTLIFKDQSFSSALHEKLFWGIDVRSSRT
ncbi:NAD(+)/NADH kinase [Ichthyobacterium seriolicida]|uniref:NAD kinase n=1 Tax=Ichthyobacterium seriolicida TaxID=242600 RepID=A0A1J1E1L1_9FLAO|nr:NAD(+)/NADH kinase [Ichthyobacterium seriolicida]BAV94837.1 inorganic polyphosphate/ATP-NAD kinase [Ichthyobacterium seriolicida]